MNQLHSNPSRPWYAASNTRRSFLKGALGATAAFQIVPRHVLGGSGQVPPSERLNLAGVGVGGQGSSNVRKLTELGQRFVALCDVDESRATGSRELHPNAAFFADYRKLLESVKGVDAVVVCTPDHMHAPVALAAMRMGKHVYVEKPMAHSIEEARLMTLVAKQQGVVSQMGNSGHGGEGLRLTREWIEAGAIGTIREVHCWSDRPGTFWKQNLKRPTDLPTVKAGLHWDLWLGAAPERPYHPVYCPSSWRGWFDFGTGAMGDMAIHNMDPAFYALGLGAPRCAEAETSQPLETESYPLWQTITYAFAARGNQPGLTLTWYDGGKKPAPPPGFEEHRQLGDNGIYFVGDKGSMLCGGWAGPPRLVPESLMKTFERPPATLPRSPGHHAEWVQACKAGDPTGAKAGFSYSGPYTEALLVGNLAVRLQKKIEWDAHAMRAVNAPEADALIRKTYRDGFGIHA